MSDAPISLQKGGNISLSKADPSLTEVLVGLGWSARATDGAAFDLDASAFALGENEKTASNAAFVYFGNKEYDAGKIVHHGDNRTGEGEGDDEQLSVNLAALGADIKKVVFAVSIHDTEERKQTFGQVSNAYIRVTNKATGAEIARYDLSEDASMETAMVFGELYRHGDEWKFKAIGQGFAGGMKPLVMHYGVSVA